MKNVAVFGGGPHGRVIIDILNESDAYKVVGIIDSEKEIGSEFYGLPIIGRQEDLIQLSEQFNFRSGVVALGDNYLREKVAKEIMMQIEDFEFVNVIHKNCSISNTAKMGVGNVFMAGAIVNSEVEIGNHCIVNTNSFLEHNCKMSDFSSLSPGVTTGGYMQLGKYSALTLGVTVLDRITIGENVVVGSGSLVLKDLDSHGLYYGVPVKRIRDRKPFERFLK